MMLGEQAVLTVKRQATSYLGFAEFWDHLLTLAADCQDNIAGTFEKER
jgi:hypothetical protein